MMNRTCTKDNQRVNKMLTYYLMDINSIRSKVDQCKIMKMKRLSNYLIQLNISNSSAFNAHLAHISKRIKLQIFKRKIKSKEFLKNL